MGYRPVEQALEEPIDKILEGMNEFSEATQERIRCGEWKDSHIEELQEVRKLFVDLETRLTRIKKNTW